MTGHVTGRIRRIVTDVIRQHQDVFVVRTRERLKSVGKSVGSSACQPSRAAVASAAAIIGWTSGVAAPT